MKICAVIDAKSNCSIARNVLYLDSFFGRLKGLLGQKSLDIIEGAALYPCSSIHTAGMQFCIDVIFLDKDKKVLLTKENMKPFEKLRVKEAEYVLELACKSIDNMDIKIGDRLEFTF